MPVSAEMAQTLLAPVDNLPEWQTVEEIEGFVAAMLPLLATIQDDPRNPHSGTLVLGERPEDRLPTSAFEGPAARLDVALTLQPGVRAGMFTEHRLSSRSMNEDIRVWLHVPGSWDGASELGLLVVYDGQAFVRGGGAAIMDNLNAEGVGPFATAFVDSVGIVARHRYLGPHDRFIDFIARELGPWVGEQVPRTQAPTRTAVAGASLGGYAAIYTALRAPDLFGGFLAQSPSLHISREQRAGSLYELVEQAGRLPDRAYIQVGLLESFLLPRARQMRDLLRARSIDLGYREVMTGHDNFAETIGDGIRFLFRA
jgi:enterochelin esterase family protein